MPYVRLLRPHQWVKNVFVLAGIVFGQKANDPAAWRVALLGLICVCLVSSAIYVFNDIRDRDEDRRHPRKSKRPIAAGEVSVPTAGVISFVAAAVGLGGAWLLGPAFFLVVAVYAVLQVTYTLGLKHAALLDVIAIALGFVLRAVAGAVLVHVSISVWLVLCTFTVCLFMGFSKRRCEVLALESNGEHAAASHRRTLALYTPSLLNHMTTVSAGIAVISYMLYATDHETITKFGTNYLAYTLPIVVYAVFRFALLVEHGFVDGPTDVILRDRPFQVALALWGICAVAIVYYGPALKHALAAWSRLGQ
jgi:4-hydroxybenzoate polyprenyltransferase